VSFINNATLIPVDGVFKIFELRDIRGIKNNRVKLKQMLETWPQLRGKEKLYIFRVRDDEDSPLMGFFEYRGQVVTAVNKSLKLNAIFYQKTRNSEEFAGGA